ncbi:MAG: hypothetical protein C0596_07095 [Marinilabiliales bacterium]|nr:MAG: hypothetical protein C0596_07095 [Marinilabiliales bacterium]
MEKKKKILISPLNWGLGHASRIVPVVNTLQAMGHDVLIGGSGTSIDFLKEYYNSNMFVFIPSPDIKYGKKSAIGPGFAVSFISFVKSIYRDYFALKKIINEHKIDVVISDNRPGLFSSKLNSIYISHQINVKTRKPRSLSGKLVRYVHRKMIYKFNHCLIPDNENSLSLAGELSKAPLSDKFTYVGTLSRFYNYQNNVLREEKDKKEVLVILYGPEPHRSIFEDILLERFSSINLNVNFVRGIVGYNDKKDSINNKLKFYDNPDDAILYKLIKQSDLIICRSGYSTLMDLAICGRKALLVPTPGQPEQEYLAEHFRTHLGFKICTQDEIRNIKFEDYFNSDIWHYPFDSTKLKKVLDLRLKTNNEN